MGQAINYLFFGEVSQVNYRIVWNITRIPLILGVIMSMQGIITFMIKLFTG